MKVSRKDVLKFFIAIIVLGLIFRSFVIGFRLPSEYVMAQNMFTYKYGFIPRGLIGTIICAFGESHLYSYTFQYVLIISVCIIFYIWLFWNVYQFVQEDGINEFIGLLVIVGFVCSPCGVYYSFESGYYEQFGFLLVIGYIEYMVYRQKKKLADNKYIFISAILMMISLLISETNAFLVCPLIVFITLVQIIQDGYNLKNLGLFIITYLPGAIYCIIVNFVRVPEEKVVRIIENIKEHTDSVQIAKIVDALGLCMYGERSPKELSPTFEPFVWYWPKTHTMIYLLLLIGLVLGFFLCNKKFKEGLIYFITTCLISFFSYCTSLIAWDFDRYWALMGINAFIFSIFFLRTVGKGIGEEKNYRKSVFLVLLITAFVIGTYKNKDARYWLMNNGTYNETWNQFIEKWSGFYM